MATAGINTDDLITLIRDGRREGFNCLYQQYGTTLYNAIFHILTEKELAENLLEAAFVYIFTNIHHYNKTETMHCWLMRVAQSVCAKHTGVPGINSNDIFGMISNSRQEITTGMQQGRVG